MAVRGDFQWPPMGRMAWPSSPSPSNPASCGTEDCATLAAGPGKTLWLTNGGDIWRLDATSGVVEGQFAPVSSAPVLAPSPTGAFLYTSGKNPATPAGAVVDEYATSSGSLLAQAIFARCIVSDPVSLAAGPGDAWASCRDGNAGDVTELASSGLAETTRPPTYGVDGPFLHFGNIGITTSGGPLWLDTEGELFCADAADGRIQAKEPIPVNRGFGPFAVTGSHVYSTEPLWTSKSATPSVPVASVVVSVAAPKTCFAG